MWNHLSHYECSSPTVGGWESDPWTTTLQPCPVCLESPLDKSPEEQNNRTRFVHLKWMRVLLIYPAATCGERVVQSDCTAWVCKEGGGGGRQEGRYAPCLSLTEMLTLQQHCEGVTRRVWSYGNTDDTVKNVFSRFFRRFADGWFRFGVGQPDSKIKCCERHLYTHLYLRACVWKVEQNNNIAAREEWNPPLISEPAAHVVFSPEHNLLLIVHSLFASLSEWAIENGKYRFDWSYWGLVYYRLPSRVMHLYYQIWGKQRDDIATK